MGLMGRESPTSSARSSRTAPHRTAPPPHRPTGLRRPFSDSEQIRGRARGVACGHGKRRSSCGRRVPAPRHRARSRGDPARHRAHGFRRYRTSLRRRTTAGRHRASSMTASTDLSGGTTSVRSLCSRDGSRTSPTGQAPSVPWRRNARSAGCPWASPHSGVLQRREAVRVRSSRQACPIRACRARPAGR